MEKLIPKHRLGDIIDTIDSKLNSLGEWGKLGVLMVDPTGISGWKDVKDAGAALSKEKSIGNITNLALATLGVIPVIGGLSKLIKPAVQSNKLFRARKIAKAFDKTVDATKLPISETSLKAKVIPFTQKKKGIEPFASFYTKPISKTSTKTGNLSITEYLTKLPMFLTKDNNAKYLQIWRDSYNMALKNKASKQKALSMADYDLVMFIQSEGNNSKTAIKNKLKGFTSELILSMRDQRNPRRWDVLAEQGKSDTEIISILNSENKEIEKAISRFNHIIDNDLYNQGKLSLKSITEIGATPIHSGYEIKLKTKRNPIPLIELNSKGYPLYDLNGTSVTLNVVKDSVVLNAARKAEKDMNLFYSLPTAQQTPVFEFLIGKYGPEAVMNELGEEIFKDLARRVRKAYPYSSLGYKRRNLNLGLDESHRPLEDIGRIDIDFGRKYDDLMDYYDITI